MKALAAVIALLVLGDVAIAGGLVAHRALAPALVASQETQTAHAHPCNHGYYVSQAAHAKKGGSSVSRVAKSKLGKDGNCSAKAAS
jgi:hypothetical protein